jgi:hypothetical protein
VCYHEAVVLPRLVVVASVALALIAAAAGCGRSAQAQPPAGRPDPNTLIDVTGAIGGIHARETRARVEHMLGHGTLVSAVTRHPSTGAYSLLRVSYPAAGLLVVYVRDFHRTAVVFGVFTTSPRYHTATGLRVGSSLADARRTPGIRCFDQVQYFACQGGLGYEKPVTSFTVRDGRVVRVFMVAVAD